MDEPQTGLCDSYASEHFESEDTVQQTNQDTTGHAADRAQQDACSITQYYLVQRRSHTPRQHQQHNCQSKQAEQLLRPLSAALATCAASPHLLSEARQYSAAGTRPRTSSRPSITIPRTGLRPRQYSPGASQYSPQTDRFGARPISASTAAVSFTGAPRRQGSYLDTACRSSAASPGPIYAPCSLTAASPSLSHTSHTGTFAKAMYPLRASLEDVKQLRSSRDSSAGPGQYDVAQERHGNKLAVDEQQPMFSMPKAQRTFGPEEGAHKQPFISAAHCKHVNEGIHSPGPIYNPCMDVSRPASRACTMEGKGRSTYDNRPSTSQGIPLTPLVTYKGAHALEARPYAHFGSAKQRTDVVFLSARHAAISNTGMHSCNHYYSPKHELQTPHRSAPRLHSGPADRFEYMFKAARVA